METLAQDGEVQVESFKKSCLSSAFRFSAGWAFADDDMVGEIGCVRGLRLPAICYRPRPAGDRRAKDPAVTRACDAGNSNWSSLDRIARVIGRSGLAIVGALCGLFVADQLARLEIAAFSSVVFFVATMFSGGTGFYLGIDVPLPLCGACGVVVAEIGGESKAALAGVLGAAGTFVTAVATLMSVSVVVLDQPLPLIVTLLVGTSWLAGVAMQIAAGVVTHSRHRAARTGGTTASAKACPRI